MPPSLPQAVMQHLAGTAVASRLVAFFAVDGEGRIMASGGALEDYGLSNPRRGERITDLLTPLDGMFPPDEPPLVLPAVETESGPPTDLHVVQDGEQYWVVLLDASEDVERLRVLQQQGNELSLLRERRPSGPVMGAAQRDPGADVLATALLEYLNIAVLEPTERGQLRMVGHAPSWFVHLWPEAEQELGGFDPERRSVFLEYFMEDARECWAGRAENMRKSGVWTETDRDDREWYLHATAVRLGTRAFLLVEDAGTAHAERLDLLQRARENVLRHHALKREIEKRDVLLGCIVHDLRTPLVSISSALELLQFEAEKPRAKELITAALAQVTRQDILFRTILDTFAADVEGLKAEHAVPVDALRATRVVVEMFDPLLAFRRLAVLVDFEGPEDGWWVAAHRSRLERVLANLLENAARHSDPGGTIAVLLRRGDDHVEVAVEDGGPGVPPDAVPGLFQRFLQAGSRHGTAGLGLHFCRLAIEGWSGTIGYTPRQPHGSRFWFRLPHTQPPE